MRRVTSLSPSASSSPPSPDCLSISKETSAKSRGGRVAVPAKITSSMPPPRSDLGLDSPIAQRIASSRLDLPQPLGPTTPVSPRSIRSSAGSTKLLKPLSLSRLIRTYLPSPRSSSASGALEEWLQTIPVISGDDLAINEQGRCALDATGAGRLPHCGKAFGRSLVTEASASFGRRDAMRRAGQDQARLLSDPDHHLSLRKRA